MSKEYQDIKNQLIKEINYKAELQEKLSNLEDSIYEKENEYFQESVYGNIIKGFENFNKNTSNQNKRKIIYNEDDHIFSLSSISYIKNLMKRQGEDIKDDFDDIEDSTDLPDDSDINNGNSNNHTNNSAINVNSSSKDKDGNHTPRRRVK